MAFSIEDTILLQCSRIHLTQETLQTVADLLQQEPDWDYLLQASIVHGVAPLIYRGLLQLDHHLDAVKTWVTEAVWVEWEQLYRHNIARNRRLYRIVGEIWGAFGRDEIQAIALKDLTLAHTVFSDIGLRPIGDLDILIHQQDYERAQNCLTRLGFRPLLDVDNPYSNKYTWGVHFHRAVDNVWIDLQWNIMQLEWDVCGERNFNFDLDALWSGAKSIPIDDYQVLAPCTEDMLFHLCMHLEGHYYAELILFCDIAELIQAHNNTLNWDYFISLVKKYRVESSIYYVLLLTQQLFNFVLPISLQELAPDYFKASLFEPVFGNLATLHTALEDIYALAHPPTQTMARLETVVRRQAVYAMRWYEELDHLATSMHRLGVQPFIFVGQASEMVFPSRSLQPFAPITLLTLTSYRSQLCQALLQNGFASRPAPDGKEYVKRREFYSHDPAVGGEPLVLDIQTHIISGLTALFQATAEQETSRKDLAFKSLKPVTDDGSLQAHLNLAFVSPEEMIIYYAARVGQQAHGRLFALTGLLEFLRNYDRPIDWLLVGRLAREYEQVESVRAGLSVAQAMWKLAISDYDLDRLLGSTPSPCLFQWARYGPGEMKRYTHFKKMFFTLFCWLGTRGCSAKLAYLLQDRAWLPRAWLSGGLGLLADGLRSAFQPPKQYTVRDFAYWTEPEPPVSGRQIG